MPSRFTLFLLLAAGLCGCANPPAMVTGKVTAAGKDVTTGGIVFAPIADEGVALPGGPGLADIKQDGTYEMKIEPGPNGLAKRFTVRFTPTPPVSSEEGKLAVIPYEGMIPKETTVAIKPGPNVINIELVPGPKR